MAGVGFELKKIFDQEGYLSQAKGFFVSSLVTVGPFLLVLFLYITMQQIMNNYGVLFKDISVYRIFIIFSFILSFICYGTFTLFSSRYVSDAIYGKQINRIFPSFLGFSVLCTIVLFITSLFVMRYSDYNFEIKVLMFLFAGIVGLNQLLIGYLSAIKQYYYILIAYVIGIASVFVVFFLGINILNIDIVIWSMISSLIGYVVIFSVGFIKILIAFGYRDLRLKNCFRFIKEIDQYYQLILIGFALHFGLYSHNFIFWIIAKGITIENTFILTNFYDIPSFYALITTIPATIIFTVKVESYLYPAYHEFYNYVTDSGNIKEIERAKEEMSQTISFHMKNLIEVQFIITFASIILGIKFLPAFSISFLSLDIYTILALASFGYIVTYLNIVLLLYFDARREALYIGLLYLLTVIIFTIISISLGQKYYGYGYFVATLITMIVSSYLYNNFIRNIEYRTFTSQEVYDIKQERFFSKIYNFIFRIKPNIN